MTRLDNLKARFVAVGMAWTRALSLWVNLQRAREELKTAKMWERSWRQQQYELNQVIKAREATIESLKADANDPLAAAKRLLNEADALMEEALKGRMAASELRAWRYEYIAFKRRAYFDAR